MDSNDFRSILESAGIDIWMLMDVAIAVASADHSDELRRRRDGIVERLYATSFLSSSRCPNCNIDDVRETEMQSNPSAEEEKDTCEVLFDDEQKKILEIKEQLEDPHQSKDSLLELLQNLADMDITFRALQETDIGRHVNRLRKHSSNDVKKLVKLLVRKWKEIIDEWVKLKTPGEASTTVMADEDSPQDKIQQNEHRQIPDFADSPNLHNESFGSEHNNIETQQRKPKAIPHKESPLKPSASRQRESNFELDKLASARKRLQENYKEVANAKKQRTIQVMDLHELPKPKNAYFGKGKGGTSQGRHW
ncbi:probable mediator of RNA polymerase II transcription subunit 26c isoform X1 [Vigna umbellata]|uniref:probable mediator of RNA polymerase II transcription subunit 26c isoform X1 n=1 Tax=Vigna umbellata TaxID=87088 RepID=UPI001F5E60D5|nr:probable mediator of RNA polymerase II transcription subunit 26c isoform X1 [Vigna umbellata]XP_047173823.1 probable mediator of RNA polymerase II transcription subunit 26c isoform X1 [Vigna umbellata]